MIIPRSWRIILALTVATAFLCGVANAANRTWDTATGDGGTITDGSGTWTTANAWNTGAGNATWSSATPDTAIIGGGTLGSAGTITVGTVTVAGITFNTPNGGGSYTLQSGTITPTNPSTTFTADADVTFASTVTISIPSSQQATNLILSGTATNALINGPINDSSAGSKNLSLDKQGAGTWLLSGTNTYHGTTTVDAGTLKLSGTGSFTQTSGVVLNGGTFCLASSAADQIVNTANFTMNGGTLQLGAAGINETVGTLSLTASSVIDFGSLGGEINFATGSPAWSGGTLLNVYNWTNGTDHLFFGSTSGGLIAGNVSQIRLFT
ncbi:MAG TPA: autotransporter-associated beta strand repeat-containing protein, partial [Verrucomicrobiaceae bacterium]